MIQLTEGSMGFVNYAEGIYVGYKFYETAAEEGLIKYEDMVQYPFGYGLSYTTFDKQIENFKDNGDTVTFDVTVENTGSVAGKDVVEIYYTAPYTNGGIEKAAANTIAFEKTILLRQENPRQNPLPSTKKIWLPMILKVLRSPEAVIS